MIHYLPSICTLLFAILTLIAMRLYPGGSQHSTDTKGYSWMHNYMCDIAAPMSISYDINPARPYAIWANVVLALGIALLFFFLPTWVEMSFLWHMIFRIIGPLSMLCGVLIFSRWHNVMIGLTTLLAIPPFIGLFVILYQLESWSLLGWGLACMAIVVINNGIFYLKRGTYWLPLLQKISYAQILIWIVWMNIELGG